MKWEDDFMNTLSLNSKGKKIDIKIMDEASKCTLFESKNERGDRVMKRVFEILNLK